VFKFLNLNVNSGVIRRKSFQKKNVFLEKNNICGQSYEIFLYVF